MLGSVRHLITSAQKAAKNLKKKGSSAQGQAQVFAKGNQFDAQLKATAEKTFNHFHCPAASNLSSTEAGKELRQARMTRNGSLIFTLDSSAGVMRAKNIDELVGRGTFAKCEAPRKTRPISLEQLSNNVCRQGNGNC